MRVRNFFLATVSALTTTLLASTSWAQENLGTLETIGKPVDGLMGWQPPVTEVARDIQSYDTFLLWVITIISLFVTALLLICAFRYSAKRNPEPATFTHHTGIEIAWTLIPVVILLCLIPPSLTLLFKQMEIPEADVTIKATGNQWYWSHEYVEHEFGFDSFMLDQLLEFPFA